MALIPNKAVCLRWALTYGICKGLLMIVNHGHLLQSNNLYYPQDEVKKQENFGGFENLFYKLE
jgi:hypothetical protein